MVGIRDAHVEKHTPDRKKNKLNTMRCFCLISIAKLSANVSAKVFIPAPVVVAAHKFCEKNNCPVVSSLFDIESILPGRQL